MHPPPSPIQVWPQRHQFSLEVDLAIENNSERGRKEDWRHLRIRWSTCVQLGQFESSNLVDFLPERGNYRDWERAIGVSLESENGTRRSRDWRCFILLSDEVWIEESSGGDGARERKIRHSRRQSASVSTCPLSANLGHLPPQHIFLPHQLPDHPNDTVARASNTNVGTPDERHNFGKIKPEPVSKAGGSQLRSG